VDSFLLLFKIKYILTLPGSCAIVSERHYEGNNISSKKEEKEAQTRFFKAITDKEWQNCFKKAEGQRPKKIDGLVFFLQFGFLNGIPQKIQACR
jgi:hypothetical protein